MSRPELLIIALIYAATLVLGQRAAGVAIPSAQEIGFAIAAVLAWQSETPPDDEPEQ